MEQNLSDFTLKVRTKVNNVMKSYTSEIEQALGQDKVTLRFDKNLSKQEEVKDEER